MSPIPKLVSSQRALLLSGKTRDLDFRRNALLSLGEAIRHREQGDSGPGRRGASLWQWLHQRHAHSVFQSPPSHRRHRPVRVGRVSRKGEFRSVHPPQEHCEEGLLPGPKAAIPTLQGQAGKDTQVAGLGADEGKKINRCPTTERGQQKTPCEIPRRHPPQAAETRTGVTRRAP